MKKAVVNLLLPIGTRRRIYIQRLVQALRRGKDRPAGEISYATWIKRFESQGLAPTHIKGPLISIVVPLYDTPPRYLKAMIESVNKQTYANWQLCLVEGGSSDSRVAQTAQAAAQADKRIIFKRLSHNLGIAGNTNAALELATGQYIAFLDHDDVLAPSALNEVVSALTIDPSIDLLYSDEDHLSRDGRVRLQPFFKPDWSPDLFLGVNYMAHFVVVRTKIARELGGIREGFEGAQDYDFLLRVTERKPKIHHIPRVLYHWRQTSLSTSALETNKSHGGQAGRKALAEYLERNQIPAQVVDDKLSSSTFYHVKYSTRHRPLVSIIIPFKDKPDYLKKNIDKILHLNIYQNYEIILVSNNSTEAATFEYLKSLKDESRIIQKTYDHPFNYSAVNNYGRSFAKGEILLFLNNDVEAMQDDWLEELVGVTLRPEVGAVGGWLFYPDNTTQHAGVVLGLNTMAGHVMRFTQSGDMTMFGSPNWPRNYLSVTGACTMMRASVFDEVGGFDERFIICGSDVSLCLAVHEAGYRNIFWPFARMRHYESVSVGSYANIPAGDVEYSLEYYTPYLRSGDPFFNRNLDPVSEKIALRSTY